MSEQTYKVQKGDTLWGICKKQFNLKSNTDIANKVKELQELNSIFDGFLGVGDIIYLSSEEKLEETAIKDNNTDVEIVQTEANTNEPKKNNIFFNIITQLYKDLDIEKKSSEILGNKNSKLPDRNEFAIFHPAELKKPEELKDFAYKGNVEPAIPEGYKIAPNGKLTKIYSQAEVDKIIKEASKKYKIDEHLISTVINIESSGNQFAKSKRGAQGYMQLMPKGGGFGLDNAYDALRAYNWGEGNYNKYLAGIEQKMPIETQKYIEKISKYYKEVTGNELA